MLIVKLDTLVSGCGITVCLDIRIMTSLLQFSTLLFTRYLCSYGSVVEAMEY